VKQMETLSSHPHHLLLPSSCAKLTFSSHAASAGLLRFLDLIASHPWSSKALFVDPEKQTGKEQRAEAQARYDARRKPSSTSSVPLEGPFMCLCTPKDLDSRHW
jgi:hypothetical protein